MNNSNFCGRCGKPLAAGQQFCDGCGAPVNAAPAKPAAKPKRKTYTAQKFISMGFAIGDIIFAISFFLCGIAFEALAEELMKEAARFNKENPGYEMKYMPGVLGVNGKKIYFEVFDTPKREGVKNEASIYKYIICW